MISLNRGRVGLFVGIVVTGIACGSTAKQPFNVGAGGEGGDFNPSVNNASVTSSSSPSSASVGGATNTSSTTSMNTVQSSSSIMTNASASTGIVNDFSNLGATCSLNSDCGGGLTCATSLSDDAVFGGGPASGYCTAPCTTNADCGNQGECSDAAGGECLLTCTPGPALMYIDDPLDPTKCQGRVDLKCAALADMTTVCLPSCGENVQCDGNRVCDPQSSVCVTPANVHTGSKLGTVCDPNAMPDLCAGACGQFNFGAPGMANFCSEGCTLGGDIASTTNCGGLDKGLCIFSPTDYGAGDQGFCDPACTKQDDCNHPVTWCSTVTFQQGNGYCLPATDCPNGANDCSGANDVGTTCTQTKFGPKCLDPQWPLGSAAP